MPTPQLHRSIGLVRATAMVVGIIIGASIFVQPSAITAEVPTVTGALAVWIVAGFLTLIGSLVIAELSSAYPRTGGVYAYLAETFGPVAGFLWGWAMFWTMHSGIVAIIAMVFARYLSTFVHMGDAGIKFFAVASIVVLSAVNYRGVRQGTSVQVVLTCIKVAALVLIIAIAVWLGARGVAPGFPEAAPAAAPTIRNYVVALIAGLFAYGGWHMVSYAAEETVNPTRTIPRALLVGTLTVTALYVGVNAAYLYVLPLETVVSSNRVAADFADVALGGRGKELVAVMVMLSALGAMNGVILAGPRVYLAMARDGLLFTWAGAIHPEYRTPHRALVMQAVWSSVLALTGTYRALFTRVVYTEWIFFAMLAVAVFVLRRRATYAPAYRAWGYPILPALFIVFSLGIVVNQVISEPLDSAYGLGLVLVGLPVYYLWLRTGRTPLATASTTQEPTA